jgi:hypothetical protein
MSVITYVMSQPAHLPYLVVSLSTLRRHYDGEVLVHAWEESFPMVERIAKDPRLRIHPVLFNPDYKKKNAQFECKQHVIQDMQEHRTVMYLDADTMIAGSLGWFLREAENVSFLATQFNAWTTQGRIIQGRVKRLRPFSGIDQEAVEEVLSSMWPSLNGGVFACSPSSPVLAKWIEWTRLARKIFISDETCLHALMPHYMRTGQMKYAATGSGMNCSPIYQPKFLPHGAVRVWHFHGDCNTRPTKSAKAVKMWWPQYVACLGENVGGIMEWRKDARHKFLDPLEGELMQAGSNWEKRVDELAKKK